jgi:hypothetical protein
MAPLRHSIVRGRGRSRSSSTAAPLRRRGLALAIAIASATACGDRERGRAEPPLAFVGDEPVHRVVVEHVAARDGVDADEARRRVADVHRLVARAKAEQEGIDDPADLVPPHRVRHLERTARARLWLETDFEPRHRPEDIPDDDAKLVQARASRLHIHPVVHMVCQLIAMPPDDLDHDDREAMARDPKWRAHAEALLDPVAQRLRLHLPPDEDEPCKQIQGWMRFEAGDDRVRFRVESGGFDLEACAERADDGSCAAPAFSPRWTEPVSHAEGRGFLPPFFTEFGLHLVYVIEIRPARSLDDPDTDAYLRAQVHPDWQRLAFARYVQRLHEKHAVRIAPSSALGDQDDPEPGGR